MWLLYEFKVNFKTGFVPNRKVVSMNKEEIIDLMLDSINTDNRDMCKQFGMSDEDIEKQIDQSQASLVFIISNMYQRLREAEVIA
jgi:hypothetical protein